MAVTVITQPSSFMPAYNPQWFIASSTQTAQTNFSYYVTVTDLISGEILIETPAARPSDGKLVFNSGVFAEKFIDQVNPSGNYGFQLNTGAIRKIRVNIGERYGSTLVVYPGSNVDYIVWNGVLNREQEVGYSQSDYLYTLSAPKYLTANNNPSYSYGSSTYYCNQEVTYEGRSNYLYCLSSANGDFEILQIQYYDWSGNLIATNQVTNPYAAGTTYTNKLVYVDVGYDGLMNFPGAQITFGPSPMPINQAMYYTVSDYSTGLANATPLKKIYVKCEPKFDVLTAHFLGKKGQFESFNFSKLSERSSEVTRTSYSRYPYELNGSNQMVWSYGKPMEKTLSITEKNKITVHSDWLTVEEVARLKELASSPLVYVDDGDSRGYMAMKVNPKTYQENKRYNSPLLSVSFDFEKTYTNHRQRG